MPLRRAQLPWHHREDEEEAEIMTALRALLAGIVDYAGLFPPAGLDMPAAVRNYASYRTDDHAWMLGRFVVPASRLGKCDAALAQRGGGGERGDEPEWRLVGAGSAAMWRRRLARRARLQRVAAPDVASIDSVEVKLLDGRRRSSWRAAACVERLVCRCSPELPDRPEDPQPLVEAVKRAAESARRFVPAA